MLTMNSVNKAIAERQINAELVKGKGYFWFDGPDVEFASSTSVMVYRLNFLSLEQWMMALDSIIADSKENSPKVSNE